MSSSRTHEFGAKAETLADPPNPRGVGASCSKGQILVERERERERERSFVCASVRREGSPGSAVQRLSEQVAK